MAPENAAFIWLGKSCCIFFGVLYISPLSDEYRINIDLPPYCEILAIYHVLIWLCYYGVHSRVLQSTTFIRKNPAHKRFWLS